MHLRLRSGRENGNFAFHRYYQYVLLYVTPIVMKPQKRPASCYPGLIAMVVILVIC